MLLHMRTTFLIDDALYRDVKSVAATDGRTVTSVVEEALRALLRERGEGHARGTYAVEAHGHGGLLPGVDLNNSAALLDLMDQP
jgi:Arc/MetJ family transcription regulator